MNRMLAVLLLVAPLLAPIPSPAHEGHDDHPDLPRPAQQVGQPTAPPSTGGLYRWMDSSGRVHYSQGLDSVPEEFRAKAVPLGQGSAPAAREKNK